MCALAFPLMAYPAHHRRHALPHRLPHSNPSSSSCIVSPHTSHGGALLTMLTTTASPKALSSLLGLLDEMPLGARCFPHVVSHVGCSMKCPNGEYRAMDSRRLHQRWPCTSRIPAPHPHCVLLAPWLHAATTRAPHPKLLVPAAHYSHWCAAPRSMFPCIDPIKPSSSLMSFPKLVGCSCTLDYSLS
jgi:hypothetical protein